MIKNLHVRNVALIDEADMSFTSGLNILTGETGAGKSILIESLGLALGDRADLKVIRSGKSQADVELTLSADDPGVNALLEESGIDTDDNEIIIRRRITPAGSDCFVNGRKVTLKELARITAPLIDICGQRESLTLLKESSLKNMLDAYGGDKLTNLLDSIKKEYEAYNAVLCKLNDIDEDEALRKRKADLAEYEVNEIESASLKPGEDTELENTFRRLSNASRISEALSHITSVFEENEGVLSLLSRSLRDIHSVSEYDDSLKGFESTLTDIDSMSSDLIREILGYMSDSDYDAEYFEDVTSRLDLINRLKDKYGHTIKDILTYLEERQHELERLSDHEAYMEKLSAELSERKASLAGLCGRLHDLRVNAASSLEKELKLSLKDMNFLDCDLKIAVSENPDRFTSSGYDDIDFMISLNPGEPLMPLSQVASGGELSRVMLAIKCISGDRDGFGTLIFDEIDTGISGITSWKVGEKLHLLAGSHQVICITHQAQVAAQADTHFIISKSVSEGRTLTDVQPLDEKGMINELMRMMGTGEDSEAARSAALELKERAGHS